MIAADVMTRQVFAIGADTPIAQAIRIMSDRKLSGVPVVADGGRVIGMITEGDLLRRVEIGTAGKSPGWLTCFLLPGQTAERYTMTHARRVRDVMSSDVVTATEETSLNEIVDLMLRHRVKRIPIVRDERLLGIVARADLIRRVGETLETPASQTDDKTLEWAIQRAIEQERWAPQNAVTVTVVNGDASLDGCVFNLRQRDALGALAENVPGVRSVENRLVCIDPMTGIVLSDPAAN